MPYFDPYMGTSPLTYHDKFKPSDKSNDHKLPTENQYSEWYQKHVCQTCNDKDGLDFNSTAEEDLELRRFMIFRLPYMQIVNGKRSCPECVDAGRMKADFKAGSHLITKTDAMKNYKLKKEEIETLKVEKLISGKYKLIKLYKKEDCKQLGEEKQRKKLEAKEEKERAKLAKKGGKKGSKGTAVSKKRGRKASEEDELSDEEVRDSDTDTKHITKVPENQQRNSGRKRQKVNYEESMKEEESEEDATQVTEKESMKEEESKEDVPRVIKNESVREESEEDAPQVIKKESVKEEESEDEAPEVIRKESMKESKEKAPRSRGRPRKNPENTALPSKPTRGRGRPGKNASA